MGRFETKWLATEKNLSALADLSGQWIDSVHARRPPRGVVLDMDSSVSPTHGEQEMSIWNGHYACTCYHPLFVFNQFGDLERCALRPGNVHSANGWQSMLTPVVERYKRKVSRIYFRADAAFASPDVYEFLEAERIKYAIRLPANRILQERIGHLLTRPIGRPPSSELNEAPRSARIENQISTWLSQDARVGVKWKLHVWMALQPAVILRLVRVEIGGSDEGQEVLAVPDVVSTEQHIALVDAVDRAIVRHLATRDMREGGEEIHDREHGVGRARRDPSRPADDRGGADRTLADVAERAAEWSGERDVRHVAAEGAHGRSGPLSEANTTMVSRASPSSSSASSILPTMASPSISESPNCPMRDWPSKRFDGRFGKCVREIGR
jgi:Transposase DDE domain group 1